LSRKGLRLRLIDLVGQQGGIDDDQTRPRDAEAREQRAARGRLYRDIHVEHRSGHA
jgi:hypothetical protein